MPSLSEKSDQALLREYVHHGHEPSFSELVNRYQAMAFATAYRICGDRGEAQDILQQSLIVLARRAGHLTEVRCLGAWLHSVVTLEAKTSWRKANNRMRRESMAYQLNEPSEAEQALYRNVAPELDESLNAMNSKDREVLTLHYLEGHSFKSISERLGGEAASWQKRSVRALEKLSQKLRGRGVSVSVLSLGAFFAIPQAEAGISAAVMGKITKHALENSAVNTTTGIAGKLATLITMKTGIAISMASGVILAYGWGTVEPRFFSRTDAKQSAISNKYNADDTTIQRVDRDRGFTMDLVKQMVADYEKEEKENAMMEGRLRCLMFLVPKEHLEDVFQVLLAANNHQRFQNVVGAFFGRWAELDPEAAQARAQDTGDYAYQAKRAVMMTWLNQDADGALVVMLADKSKENQNFLREFLTYRCERKPREAAMLVDRLATDWPELDNSLFRMVADLWSESDALAAGEWVASSPDDSLKSELLRSMAVSVGKIRGFDGLEIANHITDPKIREHARDRAIYWWGVTSGGISLIPGKVSPVRDLSNGFPEDWTSENIKTFSFATMVNYTKNLPDLLKIAKNDEQKMLIYEGAIQGSGWSNPSAVTAAAEQLPDSFARTEQGKKTLKVFIKRWSEMDANGASEWLTKQQPGPKTDVMRAELNMEGTK